jgi:hypothetical protein
MVNFVVCGGESTCNMRTALAQAMQHAGGMKIVTNWRGLAALFVAKRAPHKGLKKCWPQTPRSSAHRLGEDRGGSV